MPVMLLLLPPPEELELEDVLLLEDELDPPEKPGVIDPVETVRVIASSFAPSSRLRISSECRPAGRLLKVAGEMVSYPLVD
jgi:hypothetical protein